MVNCSRSRSLRWSGGCVGAAGRRWSGAVLLSVNCAVDLALIETALAVVLRIAVDLALLEGLAVAWAPAVAGGRRWSGAALSYCELQ